MTDRLPARGRVLKLLAGGAVGAPILARAEALEAALTSSIAEFPFQADSLSACLRSGAYAMSAHKWVQSPKALGLLYVSESLRPRLPRMWHKTAEARLDGTARDCEHYSTRARPAVLALGDA